MKVVTGLEMASIDREAIDKRKIPGSWLMENAGQAVFDSLLRRFPQVGAGKIFIVCGKGNNGGDGFVVARLCQEKGLAPRTFLCGKTSDLKQDAKFQYERFSQSGGEVIEIKDEKDLPLLHEATHQSQIFVDSLLGTGFSGTIKGLIGQIISKIQKEFDGWTISIDIPSGVDANTGQADPISIEADITITMGLPKIGQVIPPGYDHCGTLEVAEIGFPSDLLEGDKEHPNWFTLEEAGCFFPRRKKVSRHKGDNGRILIIAGSKGLTGAATLAAQSALRVGGGLITVAIPESLNSILEVKLTEPMTLPLPETKEGSLSEKAMDKLLEAVKKADVVALGPGLGMSRETGKLLRMLLPEIKVPLVLDADGLNHLAGLPKWTQKIKTHVIATPHPGELARLLKKNIKTIQSERIESAKEAAEKTGWTIVLKGARTVTATPRRNCLDQLNRKPRDGHWWKRGCFNWNHRRTHCPKSRPHSCSFNWSFSSWFCSRHGGGRKRKFSPGFARRTLQ